MSTSLLLPNPCLLGIIFTIATHDGNQLIFHYPPKPNEFGFKATPLDINEVSSEVEGFMNSSDSDEYDNDDDDDRIDDGDEDEEEEDDLDDDDDLNGVDYDDEFDNSDIESSGTKSARTLSTESLAFNSGSEVDSIRHHRTSSSSNNKYSSGRDLLEIMYEIEQKKKRKRMLRKKKRLRDKKRQQRTERNELQSLKSSLKTPVNVNNDSEDKKKEYKIDKIFSFDVDFLSDLATPPKPLCNTRFELTVEDMVFLGLPIHINEDGNWRVSKKSKKERTKSVSTAQRSRKQSIIDMNAEKKNINEDHSAIHDDNIVHAYEGNNKDRENESLMYQFNMLFVMNPPVVEYNHRIDEMFHYIISRISILLRYEQQKTNYVWTEAQKIIKLREELINIPIKQQWKKIIEESSLAKLIADTYNSVIKSEIVNIEINGKLNSFQIPIKKEFRILPPSYFELPEGSILSSISPFNYESSQTSINESNNDMMAYFALILLDDTEKIIKDIKAEKDSVIASFIRLIKPNESLLRLSILSGLDIQEVKMFANHLVYWRRALAILPLTSRNIYVGSTIAPIKNIYCASDKFNQIFPNLPTLPTFLSMISDISTNKPKPISNIIPSRDHRDLYMDAIGWLLKHGYITQLYTFLYLKISKNIKIQVAEEIEIEIKKKLESKKKGRLLSNVIINENLEIDDNADVVVNDQKLAKQRKVSGSFSDAVNKLGDLNIIPDDEEEEDTTANDLDLDEHVIIDLNNGNDISEDKNNERVRMTDNTADNEAETGNVDIINPKAIANNSGHTNGKIDQSLESNYNASNGVTKIQFEEEEEEDTILLEPEYCSSLERRWIAKVVEGQANDIVALFYKVLKHMNGRSPQEVFLLKENISRQDMRRLTEALGDALVVVRHW